MSLPPLHTVFLGALAVALVAAAATAGWSVQRRAAAERGLRRLEAAARELRAELETRPLPRAEVAAAVEAEAHRAAALVTAWRAAFTAGVPGSGADAGAGGEDRAEAFFEIRAFVGEMRAAAGAAGVALQPDELFGFSAYARSGPDAGLIPRIRQQRVFAAAVLRALFAAQPVSLQRVERERLADEPPARHGAGAAAANDRFGLDPRADLRRAGLVDGVALRVSFVGDTRALRAFLNGLATLAPPAAVRAVAVQRVDEEPSPHFPANAAEPQPAAVPALVARPALIVVTVQSLQWTGASAASTALAGRAVRREAEAR